MINLYQILNISPYASAEDIVSTVKQKRAELDEKTLKAIKEWLLVAEVRQCYDTKLKQVQPEFFAAFAPVSSPTTELPDLPATPTPPTEAPPTAPKPKIVPKNEDTENDDDYMDLPPLWNPKAAMWWSLFFNVVFGAILQAKNWEALGEPELAKKNYQFAIVGFVLITCMALFLPKMPFGFGILMVVIWYRTLGKEQVTFFENNFAGDYERKGWVVPILLGLLAIVVWVLGLSILMAIFGLEHAE